MRELRGIESCNLRKSPSYFDEILPKVVEFGFSIGRRNLSFLSSRTVDVEYRFQII